jgi:hypothetical protein
LSRTLCSCDMSMREAFHGSPMIVTLSALRCAHLR